MPKYTFNFVKLAEGWELTQALLSNAFYFATAGTINYNMLTIMQHVSTIFLEPEIMKNPFLGLGSYLTFYICTYRLNWGKMVQS